MSRQSIPRRVHGPMYHSTRRRLGRTRYDHDPRRVLHQLAQCMNIRVATDDAALLSQIQPPTGGTRPRAACQMITGVDPAVRSIVETGTGGPQVDIQRLLQLDQRSLMRRSSSLDESIVFRSPKSVSAKHVNGKQDRPYPIAISSALGLRMLPIRKSTGTQPEPSLGETQKERKSSFWIQKERILRVSKALKNMKKVTEHEPVSEDSTETPKDTQLDKIIAKISPRLALNVAAMKTTAASAAPAKFRKPPLKMMVKAKRKKSRIEKKKKVNLRNFKQQIPIAGTAYIMEVYLSPAVIEKTRIGNIDASKDPIIRVNYTRGADLKDEYASYCGKRKTIKNWLFYV